MELNLEDPLLGEILKENRKGVFGKILEESFGSFGKNHESFPEESIKKSLAKFLKDSLEGFLRES